MLRVKKKKKKNKITAWSQGLIRCLKLLSKVWMLVRKRQEALNAINTFVQNSKELQRENEKRSPGSVSKAEPQSEDRTQIPPSDGGCREISEHELRSVQQAQWPFSRPPPGPPPGPPLHHPTAATPLDLGHVVVGEEPLLSTKAAHPPAWRIWTDTTAQLYTSDPRKAEISSVWIPSLPSLMMSMTSSALKLSSSVSCAS